MQRPAAHQVARGETADLSMEATSKVSFDGFYRREYEVTLLPKMQVETVVPDELVEPALQAIREAARTGEIGDGRVFICPVEQAYNIRTGERDFV